MPELTCPNCGKQLAERVQFCPECGTRQPEPPPEPPPGGLRTVILPPEPSTGPPPGGLRTVILPPEPSTGPTVVMPPGAPPQIPPTTRLDTLAQPAGPQAEAPTPAIPAGPLSSDVATAAPTRGRSMLWWLLGGAGCLAVVVLGACLVIGVLTLLGGRATSEPELAATAIPSGGGGIVPDDAPLVGSTVLLEDDFNAPGASSLEVLEDETSRLGYEDGIYLIEVREPETVVWSIAGGPYQNISIEVEAEMPVGSPTAAAGLIFNYQDSDNFYLYSVSNEGYYILEILQDGAWTTIIDPTQSDEIDAVRNTLRVETSGDRMTLYVNGALLEVTSDDTFTAGDIGLAVSTFEDSSGIVHFDRLVIARSE